MISLNNALRCAPLFLLFALFACRKDEPVAARSEVPVVASATSLQKRFSITSGGADFLIDAPLEKIKGHSGKVRGAVDLDLNDLKASKGTIEVDLDDLRTLTFDDPGKNKSQTEHAHNWLEIGTDVDSKRREENRWARFTIKTIEQVSAAKVADVPVKEGQRLVTLTATGDLWIHGVSSPKKVTIAATFTGNDGEPSGVHIVSSEPVRASLHEHDVKPRDLAGKFLAGALEQVGQKIDDVAQISFDLRGEKPQ
jgi:polyisoprenoid-binding protein YceI